MSKTSNKVLLTVYHRGRRVSMDAQNKPVKNSFGDNIWENRIVATQQMNCDETAFFQQPSKTSIELLKGKIDEKHLKIAANCFDIAASVGNHHFEVPTVTETKFLITISADKVFTVTLPKHF